MFTEKLINLFQQPIRRDEDPLNSFHKDLAASVQAVTEKIVINLARQIKLQTGAENLTMAGGVALNCVANGKLKESGIFKNIWIQPASGDSGGALGAALAYYYLVKSSPRIASSNYQNGSLLGPNYSLESIKMNLQDSGLNFNEESSVDELDQKISQELISGNVVGLFQGRMEFGPRALGSRSIIGDPRDPKMQSIMNLKIKKRESFRPFAPAILKEYVNEFFVWEENLTSPYMLFTTQVKSGVTLPAITHVDGSARIQIVDQNIHPRFHKILSSFYKNSGCPVLINTSFNVRGEPIVLSPQDAINCFMTTEMDVLVLENFILHKSEQPIELLSRQWINAYAKD
jgi:carbamoyltransferase